MQKNTKLNITKRVDLLLNSVNSNQYIFSSNQNKFVLPINFLDNAILKVTSLISECTLVRISQCKKLPNTITDYKTISRNRLNRNKPKFLSKHIFGPIIFYHLYKV